jgi:hypothetical protein
MLKKHEIRLSLQMFNTIVESDLPVLENIVS